MAVKITEALRQEARDYYALCAEAQALGIPTDCEDPRSPKTTQELMDAVGFETAMRDARQNDCA